MKKPASLSARRFTALLAALALTALAALPLAAQTVIATNTTVIELNGQTYATGYTINSPAALTLSVTSGTAIQQGLLSGSGDLIKTGAGNLQLTAANTYSGSTIINAGTVSLGNSTARPSYGIQLANVAGAALDLNGFDLSIAYVEGGGANGGNILLGSGSNTLTIGSGISTTFAGAISGAGSLAKISGSTLTLSGNNTYSGTTAVSGNGTLQFATTSALANVAKLTVNSGSTAAFNVGGSGEFSAANIATVIAAAPFLTGSRIGFDTTNAGGSFTYGNSLTGSLGLTKLGTGILLLSVANDYTGSTLISAGTLKLGAVNALPNGTTTIVNSGATLDLANFSATLGSLAATGSVTLGSGNLSVGSNNTTTSFGGTISGTGAVTKTGTGTLTLSGANTYSGGTTISAGTLALGGANSLADTAAVSIGSGATFNLANFSETIGGLTGGGSVTLGSAALTTGGNNSVDTFSGVISGSGSLTKLGAGSLTLSGDNTYTGGTTISSGTLAESTTGSLADTGALTVTSGTFDLGNNHNDTVGAVTLSGGTITGSGSSTLTGSSYSVESGSISAILGGTAALTKITAGTVTLAGANTYSGGTTISDGLVNFSSLVNFGSGPVTINGGSLQWSQGNTADVSSRLAALGLSGATFDTNGNNVTFASVLSGAGTLTKSGTGTLTLSGANTYSGGTTVSAGSLQIGSGSLAATGALTVGSGGTFDLGNNQSASVGAVTLSGGNITGSGSSTLTGSSYSVQSGSVSVILGGSAALTKTTAGTVKLSGANIYSGGTTISSGLVNFSSLANFGTALVSLNGGGLQWAIGNTADVSSRLTALGSSGAILDTNGNNVTFASALSGPGGLTKSGAGTLTLSGSGSFGGVTVAVGTVAFTSLASLGTSVLVQSSGTLQWAPGNTADISGILQPLVNNGIFDTNGNDVTFATPLSGGFITKTGAGTLTLPAGSTYTDGYLLWAGTISVASDTGLGAVPTVANPFHLGSYGGTLRTTSTFTLNSNRGISLGSGTTAFETDASTTLTYGGIIQGSGALVKAGAGTLVLSGTNTYTGGTTISGGLINFSTMSNLGTGNVTLDGGGLQWATGNTTDITGYSRFNRTLGAGGGIFDTNGNTLVFASALSGAGGLTKAGTGTLALSVTNTYTGATTISGGTLQIGIGTSGSLASASIVNNAALSFARSDAYTFSGDISGTGSLVKNSVGFLTLSGTNTFTGATTVNAGMLILSGGSALADTSAVNLANVANTSLLLLSSETIGSLAGGGSAGGNVNLYSGSLTTGGTNTSTTFAGAVSGNGGLTKTGSGILTLSGANTFTGATTISAGTLQIGAGGTTGSLVGNITDNATLAFNRSNALTFSGVISGSGSLTQLGTGTLTLSGTNTYSGGTTISSGLVKFSSLANFGTGLISLNSSGLQWATGNTADISSRLTVLGSSGATFDTNGNNVTFASVLSGAGGITKVGTSTLTLSGANTYSGGTTIAGGTLALGSAGALGSTGTISFNGGILQSSAANTTDYSARFSTAAGQLFAFDTNAQNLTLASALTSSGGSLSKIGTGTLILSGANTYSGTTTLSAGTLQIGNGGTTGSLTGNIIDNATLAFNRSDATTFSGIISGTGALTKSGTGTLTLSGTNTYSGGTTIAGGTLAESTTGSLADTGAFTVTSGGTFDLGSNHSDTVGAVTLSGGSITGSGSSTLTGSSYGVESGSISAILGGTAALTKTTAGTVTLSGANTYSGGTTISAGTLTENATGSLADTGALTVGSGGTFDLGNNHSDTVGAVTLSGGSITGSGTSTLTGFGYSVQFGTVSTILGGTAALTKTTAGTVTLSGANTYSGDTTISAGTLALAGGNNRLSASSILFVTGGATLDLAGTAQAVAGLGSASTRLVGNITGGTLTNNAATYLQSGTFAATFSGNSLTARLWIFGDANATVFLNGTNNTIFSLDHNQVIIGNFLTGEAAGTVKIGNANALAAATENIYIYSGTLDLNGQTAVRGNSIVFNTSTTGFLINSDTANTASYINRVSFISGVTANFGGAGNLTLSGVLSGAGSIAKSGTGTTTLSGANTYTGGTTISEGILALGAAGVLADTGAVTLNGGTLALGAFNETIGTFSLFSGSVTGSGSLSASSFTVNNSAAVSISAALFGSGALIKSGSGALTLSGANTYSGGTTISFGTVNTGHTTALGSGAVTVTGNTSILNLAGTSIANAVSISSGATVTGNGTIGGLTTISSGGTLSPGNSPGTITFTQGLTLNTGSILNFELGSSSDLIAVTGGTLTGPSGNGGVTLNFSNSGGFAAGTYTLINYTSATLSNFQATDFSIGSSISGYTYNLALSGNALQLTATASAIPEPSTYAAILGAVALCAVTYHRRKRRMPVTRN